MASYKFAAILVVLVVVSVIQSAQAQGADQVIPDLSSLPGLTPDQYNNMSTSVRNIIFQLYQSMMALVTQQAAQQAVQQTAQQNNQAAGSSSRR